MKQYHELCKFILENGKLKTDRTGTGTISYFAPPQMRFDLQKGFPLLTTKRVFWRGVVYELLWMLKGDTNIRYLDENGVHIWDDWPYEKYKKSDSYQGETMEEFAEKIKENEEFAAKWGDLGPVYGKQWRNWESFYWDQNVSLHDKYDDGLRIKSIDQIANVIEQLKKNPDSRRHLVVAFNPGEIDQMALPPCHSFFQFYVEEGKLSCQLYQRSADIFLGVPFNIASYSLLTMMIAHEVGLEPGEFIHVMGDAHIYSNHVEQVKLQLSRDFRELPTVKLNPDVKSVFDFKFEDIILEGYNPHPAIKADVAV